MAFSKLIDSPDNAMKFDVSDMESEEGQWYMDLPKTKDIVGSIEALRTLEGSTATTSSEKQKKERKPKPQGNPNTTTAKIVAIEEIFEESEEEDEDLMMYEKPDTDVEDSDDDATLVQRSKPSAPV